MPIVTTTRVYESSLLIIMRTIFCQITQNYYIETHPKITIAKSYKERTKTYRKIHLNINRNKNKHAGST